MFNNIHLITGELLQVQTYGFRSCLPKFLHELNSIMVMKLTILVVNENVVGLQNSTLLIRLYRSTWVTLVFQKYSFTVLPSLNLFLCSTIFFSSLTTLVFNFLCPLFLFYFSQEDLGVPPYVETTVELK